MKIGRNSGLASMKDSKSSQLTTPSPFMLSFLNPIFTCITHTQSKLNKYEFNLHGAHFCTSGNRALNMKNMVISHNLVMIVRSWRSITLSKHRRRWGLMTLDPLAFFFNCNALCDNESKRRELWCTFVSQFEDD